ncbi:MAG: family 1 glycosylhydrolase [Candidatus Kerfeldbacteria bacterium]|nr:family 1 glycosylhydrolase [Candidatus Kerfeldbacteria bacterium]
MATSLRFPDGFLWGAATSAHQVEGGQDNDWTEWEKLGRVKNGERSGAACDHWHRYISDFELAKSLGHTSHRFSLEWSRIEPLPGQWNEPALEHYREVVRAIRAKGIEPFVTLWHFTNPRWFAERGGWAANDAYQLFSKYVATAIQALPEVKFWLTVNEPNVYALLSYGLGYWPPEAKSWVRARRALTNLIRAHHSAAETVRRLAPGAMVGFAQNLVDFEPRHSGILLDRWATRVSDYQFNRRWLERTAASVDFIGVNHYHHQRIRFGGLRQLIVNEPQGQPQTDSGWQIFPESMYRVLKIAAEYGKPIYITENGLADASDKLRISFIRDYLVQVHRALAEGIEIRGYFYWSLLDNFEWREGRSQKFGLVEVDFTTQRRRLRPSAKWFTDLCRKNSLVLPTHQKAPGVSPRDEWFASGLSVRGSALRRPERADTPSVSSGSASPDA